MKRILHYSLQLKNLAYMTFLLLAAILIYQLVSVLPLHFDITRTASNSLTPSSIDIVGQLKGPVNITMYANSKDSELGDIEQQIREFIAIYQRHKPDIHINFVDPSRASDSARISDIQSRREMRVEYSGRTEHLTLINEQTLSSALLRLAHTRNQTLMYIDGHGERKLEGGANHDLGDFGKKLVQNGFRIASLNLAIAQDVPTNNNVLVITHPQKGMLPGEVDKILRYVDGGGNMLWLLDAEPLHGLERLSSRLGVMLSQGKIIDPDAQKMNVPTNWTIGANYLPHPATRNFNLVTVFPDARQIGREDAGREDSKNNGKQEVGNRKNWQRSTLIEVAGNGWVSRNAMKKSFDRNQDIPGPFSLAIALQRNINEREQRIVVVGNGAFLANAYAGNGGNIDLGINLINWLAGEEHLVTTQPRATLDNAINLSRNALVTISYGAVVVLPLAFIIIGAFAWWRRR